MAKNTEVVLVINPGSTSTKVAFYSRSGLLAAENLMHSQEELDRYRHVREQLEFRFRDINRFVRMIQEEKSLVIAGIAGRGGIVKPLEGGTYRINEAFLKDAESGKYGEHASNLGSLLAERFRRDLGLKECYTVDPVSSGNLLPEAVISGYPGIERIGRGHPLNMKRTARKIAEIQGIKFEISRYVVAHLGGGISIGFLRAGKIEDINDALLGMGPFSPNRAGALPLRGVIDECERLGPEELKDRLSRKSGFKAYLGTEDLRVVLKMADNGDVHAQLVYRAFVHQLAKEIGSYYVAGRCEADGIIITGGLANSDRLMDDLKKYIEKLCKVFVYPGENEMEALAEGVFRVLDGTEPALEY